VTVPVPDLADPRAPYLQIADDLRRQIKAGRYQPGDRLPSLPAMSSQYGSASETIRRALAKLRDEGLVATQSTRGTFVLRAPGEAEPSPEIARLESALQATEARLTRHINDEIAKLREELEYTQAQVMALDHQRGRAASRDREMGS
jgi:DNA-binding GntR family transcriptional regulator